MLIMSIFPVGLLRLLVTSCHDAECFGWWKGIFIFMHVMPNANEHSIHTRILCCISSSWDNKSKTIHYSNAFLWRSIIFLVYLAVNLIWQLGDFSSICQI